MDKFVHWSSKNRVNPHNPGWVSISLGAKKTPVIAPYGEIVVKHEQVAELMAVLCAIRSADVPQPGECDYMASGRVETFGISYSFIRNIPDRSWILSVVVPAGERKQCIAIFRFGDAEVDEILANNLVKSVAIN